MIATPSPSNPPPAGGVDPDLSSLELLARIAELETQLDDARKQERITHDALHAWRDAAASQCTALCMVSIVIARELEAGKHPIEVIDSVHAHVHQYTQKLVHSAFATEGPACG